MARFGCAAYSAYSFRMTVSPRGVLRLARFGRPKCAVRYARCSARCWGFDATSTPYSASAATQFRRAIAAAACFLGSGSTRRPLPRLATKAKSSVGATVNRGSDLPTPPPQAVCGRPV